MSMLQLQELARKEQIAFEKAEAKRKKQDANDARREAKAAAKRQKQEEKETRKQNETEAKKEKMTLDAELRAIKQEEKKERQQMKRTSKLNGNFGKQVKTVIIHIP
eukprot:SAG31_NODE_4068_length_3621_cov_1.783078_1_plen_106_part_00